MEKVFAIAGIPNDNFDCVKRCTASDGKVYDQPYAQLKERTSAFYLMTDFSVDGLPLGLEVEGNVGVRYVRTKVRGTGMMSFTAITKTASYDRDTPDAPGGSRMAARRPACSTRTKVSEATSSASARLRRRGEA